MPISAEDIKILQNWRKSKAIVEVDKTKLQKAAPNGVILVMCGDGDRSVETIDYLKTQLPKHRFHLHALNGGPLRFNPEVPIPTEIRVDRQMAVDLLNSRSMKEIPTLILMAHWPCGLAGKLSLGIRDAIWHTIDLGDLVSKLGWDRTKIIPMLHVDYATRMRTYFLEAKLPEQIYI